MISRRRFPHRTKRRLEASVNDTTMKNKTPAMLHTTRGSPISASAYTAATSPMKARAKKPVIRPIITEARDLEVPADFPTVTTR